jgi:hypothetical protein
VSSIKVTNGQAAQPVDSLLARVASQRQSKSSDSSVSPTFSKTLSDVKIGNSVNPPAAGQAISTVTRQNLAAVLSNSHIAANPASSSSLPATNPVQPASGMTKEQAREILATGQGDVATAWQVYYGPQEQAAQQGSSSSTGNLTAAGPPTLYTPGQSASTDPGVYSTGSYIQQLNLSGYQQQANDENSRRYANYLNAFQNWQSNGSQGTPPQPPQYETVDQNGFNNWWSQYQTNIANGNGTPPDTSMFLANAPNYGNGYYGALGTTQVGTLYNPTGASTAS